MERISCLFILAVWQVVEDVLTDFAEGFHRFFLRLGSVRHSEPIDSLMKRGCMKDRGFLLVFIASHFLRFVRSGGKAPDIPGNAFLRWSLHASHGDFATWHCGHLLEKQVERSQ